MSNRQRTLFDRTRGPNSIAVSDLVSRAEEAVATVREDYLPFVRAHLPGLRSLTDAPIEEAETQALERWTQLRIAAQDLRSSSATAGYNQLSAVASSLEWLLSEAPTDDPRVPEVARLHLDALSRLVENGVPDIGEPQVQELLSELARASNHITRGR